VILPFSHFEITGATELVVANDAEASVPPTVRGVDVASYNSHFLVQLDAPAIELPLPFFQRSTPAVLTTENIELTCNCTNPKVSVLNFSFQADHELRSTEPALFQM
jgi:hypothetical protein